MNADGSIQCPDCYKVFDQRDEFQEHRKYPCNVTDERIPIADKVRACHTKICSKCHKLKSVEDFGKRTKSPDGRQFWCRECMSENHAKHKQIDMTLADQFEAALRKRDAASTVLSGRTYPSKYQCARCGEERLWLYTLHDGKTMAVCPECGGTVLTLAEAV